MKLLLAILAVIALAEGGLVWEFDTPHCDFCKDLINHLQKHMTTETDPYKIYDEFCKNPIEINMGLCMSLRKKIPFILEKTKEHLEPQKICAAKLIDLCV
ncbi:unnamed protein product [Cylicocyclus nassatus]|uniref:Saposin B-type domain-containing protein n=1 Tax=Cylicocyclus nassatus TaxID=53992 RepID=A0AA36GFL1_CYLNA|nr:unnamed protein product [Cylicocyclus nassatus]